jgi:competence protein ComEA
LIDCPRTVHFLAGGLLLVCSLAGPPPLRAADKDLPDGEGKAELLRVCTVCHGTDRILSSRYTQAQWSESVARMVSRGAEATPDEVDLILAYLVRNYAKSDKVNVNKAEPIELINGLSLSMREAQAIVDYRKEHGAFKTVEEIQKVDGVDAKKIESGREKIEL